MYVMGTAGHVDHGKSTLVIALSGIDPDRLPEEKARGMTIDLGFAWMTTNSGEQIGIVDVPGHERLVKNMIAGVGALDFVLLIVAADDGWMPQSAEHLAILRFMGVSRGIVVITKADTVDSDWLELVKADIPEHVLGTFLEDAPVLAVDSISQTGLPELRDAIDNITQSLTPRRDIGRPRLYIDRVFTIAGRGAVVTGTLIDGSLSVGQAIAVEPGGVEGRVRDLQIHKHQIETAAPGQRVAVNFSGIDLARLSRGQCVVSEINREVTDRLWAQVTIWSDATQPLKAGRPVLVMLGSSEPEAEAYPVGVKQIPPGESGLCELRLKEPIVACLKDRFVLRWPTPQVTIGGGEVLDFGGTRRAHRDPKFIASLQGRIEGDLAEYRRTELAKSGFAMTSGFLECGPWSTEDIASDIAAAVKENDVIAVSEYLFDPDSYSDAAKRLCAVLDEMHTKQPALPGLNQAEWGKRAHVPDSPLAAIARKLMDDGQVARTGEAYHLTGHSPRLPSEWAAPEAELWQRLTSGGMQPPTREELEQGAPHGRAIVQYWLKTNRIRAVGDGLVFPTETFDAIRKQIVTALSGGQSVTVSQLRDLLGTTRKYIVPIAEALDQEGVTQRKGDVRVLADR